MAGEAPVGSGPDGRITILGALAAARVSIYDRASMLCAGQTVSAADGTWRIENLSMSVEFVVVGWNDLPVTAVVGGITVPVNAAIQDHRYSVSM